MSVKTLTIDLEKYSTYELNMFSTALRRDLLNNPENANAKKVAQVIYEAIAKYLQKKGMKKTDE